MAQGGEERGPREPWCERLSPLDAMFLDLEDASAHMHVGGALTFEGEAPTLAALLAHVGARLGRVPRYRQRLAFVPLHLGRPVWVDAPVLDLCRHVRAVRLEGRGPAALAAHTARFFAEPLDRERPLWALELVEGVAPGRFALLSKTHHCLLDGIGGVDFLEVITDASPGAAPEDASPGAAPEDASPGAPPDVAWPGGPAADPSASPPAPWRPRPAPRPAALLASALRGAVTRPAELALDAVRGGAAGRRLLGDLVAGARPLLSLAVSWPAPRSPLDADAGPDRSWATAAFPIAEIAAVRAVHGGTLNDVLLAAVAGALRKALAGKGPLPDELSAFVPVNVRRPEARGTYGNQVALVFCRLPVGEPDPAERLRRVTAETRRLKDERMAAGILAFEDLGELTPAPIAAEAMRITLAMHYFNLVVSNIPGPRAPRFLLGRRLLTCHPAIPLARGQSLSIGAMSCAGTLGLGLLGGAAQAAEVAAVAAALPEALAELVTAPPAARSPA